ncbi:MAG: hypothetical protein JOZ80_01050 [Acidobacteriaceae bacterium]|nr:hypothetical protein [Acidobacteriaceae bacterium]
MKTLNEVYSAPSMRRRYEVWFLRMGLADGTGAWWFRYLLMNPGRPGCPANPRGMPVQVWATWFPRDTPAMTWIQGFPIDQLKLSGRGENPFAFQVGSNRIDQHFCRGDLALEGHKISWDLHYRSTFRVTLSNKGWIGFSRTPHSDAVFSGRVTLDGQTFEGDPLGFGVQGHNCGYRHRSFWAWTHAYFLRAGHPASTFEALVYDMPLGLVFRRAVLWHDQQKYEFRRLQTEKPTALFAWNLRSSGNEADLDAKIDGSGPSQHRISYLRTDCSGSFEVTNNSLSRAKVRVQLLGKTPEVLETTNGAVLEVAGQPI